MTRQSYPTVWPHVIPAGMPSEAPQAPAKKLALVEFAVSREIPADESTAWKLIGDFDTMCWHPGILTGNVTKGDGKTTRSLIANGGSPTFEEELLERGGRFLRYKMVGGVPITPITSQLRVESVTVKTSRVTWSASFDPTGVEPALVSAVKLGVTAFYEAGLAAVAQVFDTDEHE